MPSSFNPISPRSPVTLPASRAAEVRPQATAHEPLVVLQTQPRVNSFRTEACPPLLPFLSMAHLARLSEVAPDVHVAVQEELIARSRPELEDDSLSMRGVLADYVCDWLTEGDLEQALLGIHRLLSLDGGDSTYQLGVLQSFRWEPHGVGAVHDVAQWLRSSLPAWNSPLGREFLAHTAGEFRQCADVLMRLSERLADRPAAPRRYRVPGRSPRGLYEAGSYGAFGVAVGRGRVKVLLEEQSTGFALRHQATVTDPNVLSRQQRVDDYEDLLRHIGDARVRLMTAPFGDASRGDGGHEQVVRALADLTDRHSNLHGTLHVMLSAALPKLHEILNSAPAPIALPQALIGDVEAMSRHVVIEIQATPTPQIRALFQIANADVGGPGGQGVVEQSAIAGVMIQATVANGDLTFDISVQHQVHP